MPAITRCLKVSTETRKAIEELIWVLGLPEECVLVISPGGNLKIENEKRDHALEITAWKDTPPEFLGPNSYQRNG